MSKIALDLSGHVFILSQQSMKGAPYWIEARPMREDGSLYYVFGPFNTYEESKETAKNFEIGVKEINDEGVTKFTYLDPFKRITAKDWNK